VCVFTFSSSAFAFLIEMNFSFNAGDRMDFTGGNLSPNLQAQFCKLYPADFVG